MDNIFVYLKKRNNISNFVSVTIESKDKDG